MTKLAGYIFHFTSLGEAKQAAQAFKAKYDSYPYTIDPYRVTVHKKELGAVFINSPSGDEKKFMEQQVGYSGTEAAGILMGF